MRLIHRRSLFLSALVLAALVGVMLWQARSLDEPRYGGKRMSAWLDEPSALAGDPNAAPAAAVRAIGTNAIPWLLSEFKAGGSTLNWRLNQLLEKQRVIKYRFPFDQRVLRALRGFYTLGPLAEPAIPNLLELVEAEPGCIPEALAGIGTAALPALQQCLTNTRSYRTSAGQFAPIPGVTIGAISSAITARRISKPEVAIFLPAIRAWAQSTNQYAADYATNFLEHWHFSLSADDESYELSKAWK
jgi:hypothetical protein